MVAKKTPRPPQKDTKSSVKRLIYENDTSGTTSTGKRVQSASTTTILETFENPETHEISQNPALDNFPNNGQERTILSWIKSNWEIIASIIGASFVAVVFFTRLDARVDVIGKDVDGIKSSLEKSVNQQIKSSTQIEQLQTSVNRLEDRQINGKR